MIAPHPLLARPPQLLEFLDFSPKITDRTTLEGRTKFDKHSTLIDRVNKWLDQHPNYDLISLESVQVSSGEPIPEVPLCQATTSRSLTSRPVTSQTPSNYIRGVRIWLRHNVTRSLANQQIVRYWTVVPNLRLRLDSTSQGAEYFTGGTDDLFTTLNEQIGQGKVRGRFLCAEFFSLYLSSDRINPELTAWSVSGGVGQDYVEALRVFYLDDPTAYLAPTLGFTNILPVEHSGAGDGVLPDAPSANARSLLQVSPIGNTDRLLAMLTEWQKTHPELRTLRVQTYLSRRRDFSTVGVNPRLIDDVVQDSTGLRVIYCNAPKVADRWPCALKSELFVPKIGYEVSLFGNWTVRHESQAKLLDRVAEWARYSEYKNNGFEVCGAETILHVLPMRLSSSFWLLRFIRWWWRRKPQLSRSVLKSCRVYYRVLDA